MNEYEQYLPEEFKSGNNITVERATITRERMLEILESVYARGWGDGRLSGGFLLDRWKNTRYNTISFNLN